VFLVAISTTMESASIMVLVPSSIPLILIVPNLVLNVVLVGEGATEGSTTKFGTVGA